MPDLPQEALLGIAKVRLPIWVSFVRSATTDSDTAEHRGKLVKLSQIVRENRLVSILLLFTCTVQVLNFGSVFMSKKLAFMFALAYSNSSTGSCLLELRLYGRESLARSSLWCSVEQLQ